MSWIEHHKESERLASAAELAIREGDGKRGLELYHQSAKKELLALGAIEPKKIRTLGITAVSAISLYYKAGEYRTAQDLGREWLSNSCLPPFASRQIQELLNVLDEDKIPSAKKPVGSRVSKPWPKARDAIALLELTRDERRRMKSRH